LPVGGPAGVWRRSLDATSQWRSRRAQRSLIGRSACAGGSGDGAATQLWCRHLVAERDKSLVQDERQLTSSHRRPRHSTHSGQHLSSCPPPLIRRRSMRKEPCLPTRSRRRTWIGRPSTGRRALHPVNTKRFLRRGQGVPYSTPSGMASGVSAPNSRRRARR
jgi:hypothetical protein